MRAWNWMRRILFRKDAEAVHRWSIRWLRLRPRLPWIRLIESKPPLGLKREVWGVSFRNPVGLAAGFDKDAEVLEGIASYGFGFAEVGTVTPRPQPGNPHPRLFRDSERKALFNRMGFNNAGATQVAEHLRDCRRNLPSGFVVGVNLGKNKDTPLETAAEDYRLAAQAFKGLADYLVINVSSPNTPGLRDLQSGESLSRILGAVKSVVEGWERSVPVLIKLAPEIGGETLEQLIRRLETEGANGWVLTNTLAGEREGTSGGWSGAPLSASAMDRLRSARQISRLPIISVGGIMDEFEAARRLELGADLVQLYAGWVFQGPSFPARVVRFLDTQKVASLSSQ